MLDEALAALHPAVVEAAARRIHGHVIDTPVLRNDDLDRLVGARLWFKCESLQRGGSFKLRGATNAVLSLPAHAAQHGVVTHSSGNHGVALSLAAASRGIAAHVVVPHGANLKKLAAIRAAGATIHPCAATQQDRERVSAEICRRTGAVLVHPYADPDVIAGQGTAARELLGMVSGLDTLIAPIGGGGLIGGTALAAHGADIRLFAAEPEGAADALESLQRGKRVTDIVPDTFCDGLRATLGELNLALLQRHGVRVLPVSDGRTAAAMRLIWEHLKLVVEPSSAVVLAALLHQRQQFAGRRVGVILSGGNVDLDHLPWSAADAGAG